MAGLCSRVQSAMNVDLPAPAVPTTAMIVSLELLALVQKANRCSKAYLIKGELTPNRLPKKLAAMLGFILRQ